MPDPLIKALSVEATKRQPDISEQVNRRFKGIAPYGLQVIDSRQGGTSQGRKLEFYPPNEERNPIPGHPTVEIFSPEFQGEDLYNIVAADFLHHLGKVDPKVSDARRRFRESMTDEQNAIDRRAYMRAQAGEFGAPEKRDYETWMDIHRLDQYIGSMMLPEGPNRRDWMGSMTPKQLSILGEIEKYMREGK